MSERMVTTSRDTLDNALMARVKDSQAVADHLIGSGAVRVIDPDDPELVERVAAALAPGTWAQFTTMSPEQTTLSQSIWRDKARAAIEAVLR